MNYQLIITNCDGVVLGNSKVFTYNKAFADFGVWLSKDFKILNYNEVFGE